MAAPDPVRLLQLVSAVAAPAPPAGDAVCAECRALLPWAALQPSADAHDLLCADCAAVRVVRQRRGWLTSVWRQPLLYVGLAVVVAAVLFLAGHGRFTPAAMHQADQDRAWNEQQLPRAYLRQAQRVMLHLTALEHQQRPPEEIRPWAALAYGALHELAALWAGVEVAPEVRLAAAEMQGRLEPEAVAAGYAEALALAPHFAGNDARALAYRLERGKLALKAGAQEAGQADLRAVLAATASAASGTVVFESFLDQSLAQQARGNLEAMLRDQVTTLSGTSRPLPVLRREAELALGLPPSPVLPAAPGPFGLPIPLPEGLTIEHEPGGGD